MTDRIITTFGRNNKKLLRDYFNNIYGLDVKNIKQIKNVLGAEDNNESWEYLREKYNDEIIKKQKAKKIARYNRVKLNKITQKEQANEKLLNLKNKITEINNPDIAKLKEKLKNYAGKSVIVEYLINKEFIKDDNLKSIGKKTVIITKDYQIDNSFTKFWKENGYDWIVNYDDVDIFTYYDNKGSIFIYPQNENIDTKKVVQLFREGITNCLLTPIRIWATEKLNSNTNKCKVTKCRYTSILKNIDEYEKTYINGVPEDAISEICNKLQIDINIEMPFCETKFIEGQSIKKRLKLFKFINTRLNHIDLNEIVSTDDFTIVTREELLNIQKELDKSNTFYTFKKDKNNISSINTLTKNYKLSSEFSEVITEFERETGLNFCKIDDIDDYQLSQFIKEGTNYNSTIDFKHHSIVPLNKLHHLDMKKAYANFKSCKFYAGFLGKITDFRQTNTIQGIGMYRITKIKIPNCKFKNFNDKLKIYLDNNVYTSIELNFLTSIGATYKIVSGCWGVKPIDFDFNAKMMEMRDADDIPFYSKWTGVCDQHQLEKKFWIKGEQDYFRAIQNSCGDKIVRWFENGEGCIAFPKKHNRHLGHISAFITAYQRLNMLEQLLEIDYKNVIRVCVDGIYHSQDNIPLKNVFRAKDDRKFGNEASESYVSSACQRPLIINEPIYREHYAKELHIGEGGSGKTHYNCNDKGLVRVMFIAPSWKLARCKNNESGVNCSVWARALSDDPVKINAVKEYANTLIIDEISMLSEEQKQKFFSVYTDMKIIMCGDLGFQLPCIVGDEADNKGFDNIVSHKTDFRCKDIKLKQVKTKLRKMIAEKQTKNYINKWVISEFKKFNRIINVDELKAKYSIEDMILSGTNELKDYYSKMFIGKFDKEKYYIMENNRLFCNDDIIIGEKPDKVKHEIRHAFTTHSIQGETANFNLFIDSSKMFDSRMFYTAISRAKTLDQIYIIENLEHTYKYEYGKIYKIVSDKGTYIGSTIQPLEVRFNKHKQEHENYKLKGGKFITSFNVLNNNAIIEKIENFKCNDLKDLWKREAEVIQLFGAKCVNKTFNEWAE